MRKNYFISLISILALLFVFIIYISDFHLFLEADTSAVSLSFYTLQNSDSEKSFNAFQYYHFDHDIYAQFTQPELKDFGYSNNYNGFLKVEIEPKTVLENVIIYIIAINLNHNSADTIKRTLLAYSNNALLLLNDDYVDNDKLVCKNFIPKFLSKVELYERIGIFKSLHADKLRQDISILKSSLCES